MITMAKKIFILQCLDYDKNKSYLLNIFEYKNREKDYYWIRK